MYWRGAWVFGVWVGISYADLREKKKKVDNEVSE